MKNKIFNQITAELNNIQGNLGVLSIYHTLIKSLFESENLTKATCTLQNYDLSARFISRAIDATSKDIHQSLKRISKILSSKLIIEQELNGHEYVDLGLPSGTKWATCNVGATSPEDYGDYFAWGEMNTKSDYSGKNSTTYGKSPSILRSSGIINSSHILTKSYDVASSNWGGSWRMPTKAEYEELIDKCKWTWTTQGGKNGYQVTGPNGNSIFLPAAGGYSGSSLYGASKVGSYWSSSVFDSELSAYHLNFYGDSHCVDWNFRTYGRPVRPIC